MNRAVAVVFGFIAIVKTRALPRWTGIVGGAAAVLALGMTLAGTIGIDRHDFGLFVFGYAAWAILIGLHLLRQAPQPAA